MKIEIRRNEPIPPIKKSDKCWTKGGWIYPWKELNVGDCFIVDLPKQRVKALVTSYNSRSKKKFIRRDIEGKQGVWRIE